MKSTVLIARSLLTLVGLALLALGILFWTGRALSLVQLHMMLGGLFVLCLWVLGLVGLFAPAARPLALLTLLWSFVVPALGVLQLRLLPGPDHWIIQAVHLLVGLIGIGLGHAVSARIGRRHVDSAPITERAG